MTSALLLTIRFYEPRYHGTGDWPPAPMRLFQALVAGAATGAKIPTRATTALAWLETLAPPEIFAPLAGAGPSFTNYVPNNDADTGSDPTKTPRSGKVIQPRLLQKDAPLHYLWVLEEEDPQAEAVCELARDLHHLGRGVDAAWCDAAVMPETEARQKAASSGAIHHRPGGRSDAGTLAIAAEGTLASLVNRYSLGRGRFASIGGKRAFRQAPKPVFREVAYDTPPWRMLFEVREGSGFAIIPVSKAAVVTTGLLRLAADRLSAALPEHSDIIERMVLGRGATSRDKLRRLRLLPLPSIGHEHVDRDIRRYLLEVPQDCPLNVDDVAWAFRGLSAHDGDGVVIGSLVEATDRTILDHYHRVAWSWATETPAVLSPRGRIGPDATKAGSERVAEEIAAAAAVRQALRQANVSEWPTRIDVQREPFARRGSKAESFALPKRPDGRARFNKHALWHVRLQFAKPLGGPLSIGDGRFAGLGLLAPIREEEGVLALRILGGATADAEPTALAAALRRATMKLVHNTLGLGLRDRLPEWFTGHDTTGAPLRGDGHNHLAFIADWDRSRLLVVAPHCFDRTLKPSTEYLRILRTSLNAITELNAGRAGRLLVERVPMEADDPFLAPNRSWRTLTPYAATRYPRRETATAALETDVQRELRRRGMPMAEVAVERIVSREGPPKALLTLTFATAQTGPVLLGKTLHKGGGAFIGTE